MLVDGPQPAVLELSLQPDSLCQGLVERSEHHRLSATNDVGSLQELILTRLVPLSDELQLLHSVLEAASGMDLTLPEQVEEQLELRCPAAGELVARIRDWIQAMSAGNREPVGSGERANGDPGVIPDFPWRLQVWSSVHDRPWPNVFRGAISLAIPLTGEPKLNGRSVGWIVTPPGSDSVWLVEGGTMAMITLKPGE